MLQLIKALKEQGVGAVGPHRYNFGAARWRKMPPVNPSGWKQIPQLSGHAYKIGVFYYWSLVIKTESTAQCVFHRFHV